jgi:hypothetical protein
MAIQTSDELNRNLNRVDTDYHHHGHAVCWRAIFAGATAAAALTIILCILGTGLGFTAVSPWSFEGISATTFGISAILWLSLTQVVASGMGGFLSGRLRNRTLNVDRDEVYFRDTAHGFLTWAVALIVTATLFASALGAVINSGVQAAAKVTAGVAGSAVAAGAMGAAASNDHGYYIDSLFRKNFSTLVPTSAKSNPNTAGNAANNYHGGSNAEVRRIFNKSVEDGVIADEDVTYLGQLIAQRTGLTQEEAEQRVKDTFVAIQNAEAKVKETADKARKASAYVALWGFIALLIGAFTASLAATWGGRCRDANTVVS